MMVQILEFSEKKSKKTKLKLNVKTKKPAKAARFKDEFEVRDPVAINEYDTDLCISIWQSVIIQAIYDIIGEGGGQARRQARAAALTWFGQGCGEIGRPTDFELVCELAHMQPRLVLNCMRLAKKNGEKFLEGFNFRSLRKSSSSRKGRRC